MANIEKTTELIYEVVDALLKKNGPLATNLVIAVYQCTPQQAHSFIKALVEIEKRTLMKV